MTPFEQQDPYSIAALLASMGIPPPGDVTPRPSQPLRRPNGTTDAMGVPGDTFANRFGASYGTSPTVLPTPPTPAPMAYAATGAVPGGVPDTPDFGASPGTTVPGVIPPYDATRDVGPEIPGGWKGPIAGGPAKAQDRVPTTPDLASPDLGDQQDETPESPEPSRTRGSANATSSGSAEPGGETGRAQKNQGDSGGSLATALSGLAGVLKPPVPQTIHTPPPPRPAHIEHSNQGLNALAAMALKRELLQRTLGEALRGR